MKTLTTYIVPSNLIQVQQDLRGGWDKSKCIYDQFKKNHYKQNKRDMKQQRKAARETRERGFFKYTKTVSLWPSLIARFWTSVVFPVPVSPIKRTGSLHFTEQAILSSRCKELRIWTKGFFWLLSCQNHKSIYPERSHMMTRIRN